MTTEVHVELMSLDPNATGVLTGLGLLARRGAIRLTYRMLPIPAVLQTGPVHLRDKYDSCMRLLINGQRRAFIDFHDSWEIDEPGHDACDVYFKRSLALARLPTSRHGKMRPLGLVNEVRSDGFDAFEVGRTLRLQRPLGFRVRELTRLALRLAGSWVDRGPRTTMSMLASPPEPERSPRVLFMAALWDPARITQSSPELVPAFEAINQQRAECVRQLRKALGDRFTGGLQHSAYSRRVAPDALLPDPDSAGKRRYLNRVRQHGVCIATTGLHGSIGCKLAEYVGLSRAIVTEPLTYQVAGPFAAGVNYLEFRTPEQCVARAVAFVSDADLRARQMQANWVYYNDWMRPDRFAERLIQTTLESGASASAARPATALAGGTYRVPGPRATSGTG